MQLITGSEMFLGCVRASYILQQARPRWSILLTDNSGYLVFLRFAERGLASIVLPCVADPVWYIDGISVSKDALKMQTVPIYIQITTTWHYNCRFASSALRVTWTWPEFCGSASALQTSVENSIYFPVKRGKGFEILIVLSLWFMSLGQTKMSWICAFSHRSDKSEKREMMNELRRRQLLNLQDLLWAPQVEEGDL